MTYCSDVFMAGTAGRRLCATTPLREQARMPDVDDARKQQDAAVQARLGAKIKARREKQGLSQGELAERSNIHRTYLSQVENGRKSVTISVLAHISTALGTTPSALTQGILSDTPGEGDHQE